MRTLRRIRGLHLLSTLDCQTFFPIRHDRSWVANLSIDGPVHSECRDTLMAEFTVVSYRPSVKPCHYKRSSVATSFPQAAFFSVPVTLDPVVQPIRSTRNDLSAMCRRRVPCTSYGCGHNQPREHGELVGTQFRPSRGSDVQNDVIQIDCGNPRCRYSAAHGGPSCGPNCARTCVQWFVVVPTLILGAALPF